MKTKRRKHGKLTDCVFRVSRKGNNIEKFVPKNERDRNKAKKRRVEVDEGSSDVTSLQSILHSKIIFKALGIISYLIEPSFVMSNMRSSGKFLQLNFNAMLFKNTSLPATRHHVQATYVLKPSCE
ncbi:CLUMA_CG012382, isoform A [Clunio marinus]|uniref:CLUMA_CG012382, isoform A n=1 Tax=Clunio marinus TaxID=568069 RepID=A0A1J1IEN3_9DIPT|nr:CLUMA_CG012382, isoform A [Clunio marinus]